MSGRPTQFASKTGVGTTGHFLCSIGLASRRKKLGSPRARIQSDPPPKKTLQKVTAASSGTHTRWWEEQASRLALSRAPVCGVRRLPEGSRRDTGGVSVTEEKGAQPDE